MRLLLALLLTSPAWAHEAARGWTYPPGCCWSPSAAPQGRLGDCDAIPTSSVVEGPDGFIVTLKPGDHPMVHAPMSFRIPYGREQQSQDGGYHICLGQLNTVRCFFAGSRGS